jgi:hypothetical protein
MSVSNKFLLKVQFVLYAELNNIFDDGSWQK